MVKGKQPIQLSRTRYIFRNLNMYVRNIDTLKIHVQIVYLNYEMIYNFHLQEHDSIKVFKKQYFIFCGILSRIWNPIIKNQLRSKLSGF